MIFTLQSLILAYSTTYINHKTSNKILLSFQDFTQYSKTDAQHIQEYVEKIQ